MTAAEARARAPSLAIATFDPARVEAIASSIVDALLAVSPRLGRGLPLARDANESAFGDDIFFVEVTSPADVDRLAAIVADLDLGPASIGVADGAFAAACAARITDARRGPPRRKIVRRRGDARFLAPLPISLLPASPVAAEALASLGLATLSLVASLPVEGVHARLGEEGRHLVALARGAPLPAIATYVPSNDPSTEIDLVDPADASNEGAFSLDAVLFGIQACCTRLLPALSARGQGVAVAELILEGRKKKTRIEVHPARPEIDPRALFELTRATLDGALREAEHARALGDDDVVFAPVDRVRLTATTLVPITHEGERLPFARRDATVLPLQVALARLRGRFGADHVVTPVRREDPRPDARGVFRLAVASASSQSTTAPVAETVVTDDAPIHLHERLRAPSPALGAVLLSRAPIPGDPWPLRGGPASSTSDRAPARPFASSSHATVRVVEEVGPPERITSGWWNDPFDLVYRWATSNDGVRALFVRSASHEAGAWKLVGVAD